LKPLGSRQRSRRSDRDDWFWFHAAMSGWIKPR
jgi:hypothetical protein